MAVTWGYRRRERFAEERGRICEACGKRGLVSRSDCGGNFSIVYNIDHIIPESKGGTDDVQNLRILCASCNSLKYDLSEEEFIEKAAMKREVEYMLAELSTICAIDHGELSALFKKINIKNQFNILTKLTDQLVSMPETYDRKYA